MTLNGDMVLAEAAYILLSLSGDPDAHERVRNLLFRVKRAENGSLMPLKAMTRSGQ